MTVDTEIKIDLVSEKNCPSTDSNVEENPICNKTLEVLYLSITTLQNTIKILESELSSKNLIIEYLKNDLDCVKNMSTTTTKATPAVDSEKMDEIFETVTPKNLSWADTPIIEYNPPIPLSNRYESLQSSDEDECIDEGVFETNFRTNSKTTISESINNSKNKRPKVVVNKKPENDQQIRKKSKPVVSVVGDSLFRYITATKLKKNLKQKAGIVR